MSNRYSKETVFAVICLIATFTALFAPPFYFIFFNPENIIFSFSGEDESIYLKLPGMAVNGKLYATSYYENTKNDLNYYINKIDHLLLKNNFEFTKNFNEHDWRILISFMSTFKEWVNNIKFFEIDNEKKYEVLKESPLISICHL